MGPVYVKSRIFFFMRLLRILYHFRNIKKMQGVPRKESTEVFSENWLRFSDRLIMRIQWVQHIVNFFLLFLCGC